MANTYQNQRGNRLLPIAQSLYHLFAGGDNPPVAPPMYAPDSRQQRLMPDAIAAMPDGTTAAPVNTVAPIPQGNFPSVLPAANPVDRSGLNVPAFTPTPFNAAAPVEQPAAVPVPQVVGSPESGDQTGAWQSVAQAQQNAAPSSMMTESAMTAPAAIMPAPVPESQQTQNRLQGIYDKDYSIVKDKDGNIIHRGADRDKHFSTKEKIGNALSALASGEGLFGAVKAGMDRNYNEKQDDNTRINRLLGQQQQQQQAEQFDRKGRLEEAQIATIPIDDANRTLQINAQKETNQQRIQAGAVSKLAALKYYDPNNAAHTALAKQAGVAPETLKGYDDRNPIEKMVDGQSYRLNRQTGAYEPTNLPTDESKALTEYTVKTPTGELRTYKVSQEKAAGFATQMQALGMNIEAANSRQNSQQTFQRGENDKNRRSAAERQQIGIAAQQKLAEFHAAQAKEQSATTAEERAAAQTQREQAAKDLAAYRDQLKEDN